jgi:aspartate/methionine/tyrosine aminotransferase
VVNSFSKYFGMTGWRLGWIVVPEAFIDTARTLAQNMYISASSIAQHAALAAFEPETQVILDSRREEFRRRRDYMVEELTALGFVLPQEIAGAFYVYADCSKFSDDSEAFCKRMLEEHGVAMTPGTDFGDASARTMLRLSFTTSMAQLQIAIARLRAALA